MFIFTTILWILKSLTTADAGKNMPATNAHNVLETMITKYLDPGVELSKKCPGTKMFLF